MATSKQTYTQRTENAVTLVWGSLRLTPIMGLATGVYYSNKLLALQLMLNA